MKHERAERGGGRGRENDDDDDDLLDKKRGEVITLLFALRL